MQEQIGKITHFFPKIGVAVVELAGTLNAGDEIVIKTKEGEIKQKVESMQMEHKNVDSAKKGQSVGLKVNGEVKPGNPVFKA